MIVHKKLLVVDQNPAVAEAIGETALNAGFEVKLTSSGHEFRESLVAFGPSHLAVGLQLPDMPWFELLYWISEMTMVPKLLLISENAEYLSMAAKLTAAWRLSVIATLSTPLSLSELEKALARDTWADRAREIEA